MKPANEGALYYVTKQWLIQPNTPSWLEWHGGPRDTDPTAATATGWTDVHMASCLF